MSSPDITNAERKAIAAVLKTSDLSMGDEIEKFEAAFREFSGMRHALGVNSGTAGLHLCVRAAGIEPGDLVLTTPFSFVASTNVLLYESAIPIFVDVEPESGNINIDDLIFAVDDLFAGEKIKKKWFPRMGADTDKPLKAILAVDVFGQPVDFDPIRIIARDRGIRIIEDSCEALGAEYKGRLAGTLGDFGVYGFYPNKQMTTGEGGVIITNDQDAAAFMKALRNQGRFQGDTWLQHTYLGYNYRLDEMSAALGRIQLARLQEMQNKRAQVAAWYNQRLEKISEIETQNIQNTTSKPSWFVYVIKFPPDMNRDAIVKALAEEGIPARPYFAPIHLQPYMINKFGYQQGDYPVTEDLGRRGLALPFSSVMREEQVDFVCEKISGIIEEKRFLEFLD